MRKAVASSNGTQGKTMTLEPVWIWGILGLVLLAAEMATGTLYILWFGIAALCLSAALALFPLMALPVQLLLFAVLALGSLAIWKLNDRKTASDLRIGQSQSDEIGRVGSITAAVSPAHNGSIRFGAKSSHLLEADCKSRSFKTIAQFTTGF